MADALNEKKVIRSDPTSVEVPEANGESQSVELANNGNVIDDGLQRGLKTRHLVSEWV
jgi:hypothetical protein